MQLFVKGLAGQTVVVDAESTDSLEHFKEVLADKEGVSPEEQSLVVAGKLLEDDGLTLGEYGIADESTMYMSLRLMGGGKKRKKKVYTKPKKTKHVHKNVKLATLKYYKVEESGKVTRLRQECPECGAGVFMASHFNRFTCGRCSTTIIQSNESGGAEDDE